MRKEFFSLLFLLVCPQQRNEFGLEVFLRQSDRGSAELVDVHRFSASLDEHFDDLQVAVGDGLVERRLVVLVLDVDVVPAIKEDASFVWKSFLRCVEEFAFNELWWRFIKFVIVDHLLDASLLDLGGDLDAGDVLVLFADGFGFHVNHHDVRFVSGVEGDFEAMTRAQLQTVDTGQMRTTIGVLVVDLGPIELAWKDEVESDRVFCERVFNDSCFKRNALELERSSVELSSLDSCFSWFDLVEMFCRVELRVRRDRNGEIDSHFFVNGRNVELLSFCFFEAFNSELDFTALNRRDVLLLGDRIPNWPISLQFVQINRNMSEAMLLHDRMPHDFDNQDFIVDFHLEELIPREHSVPISFCVS